MKLNQNWLSKQETERGLHVFMNYLEANDAAEVSLVRVGSIDILKVVDTNLEFSVFVGLPSCAFGVEQFPVWLEQEEIVSMLLEYSQVPSKGFMSCEGIYRVGSDEPYAQLVRDSAAWGEEAAVVIPTEYDNSYSNVKRKKRWTIKKEIQNALDVGCTVEVEQGGALDLIHSELYQNWLEYWRGFAEEVGEGDQEEVERVLADLRLMDANLATIAYAMDSERVVLTKVKDKYGDTLFVNVAICTQPGVLYFSHVITNYDKLSYLNEECEKKIRCSYLAIEELFQFAKENEIDYIDLGNASETDEDDAEWKKMLYKLQYKSATPPEIKGACALVFSDPESIEPMLGVNSFCNGKIIRTKEEAFWLPWDTGEENG